VRNHPDLPPLGPRPPAPAGPGKRAALSRARAAVLDAVEAHQAPSSLARLAETTGLHPNTLREHLDVLLDGGWVRREPATRVGRGRPAWLYRPAVAERSPVTEYAGLAATLAAHLHRTSADPVADAVEAGTGWGEELARAAGPPSADGEVAARLQVIEVLDRMGFDPQVDTATDPGRTTVRLTRCPLLDAAKQYPDVVCGVHLGIAKGALTEYRADTSGAALTPFAEPGACLLRLAEPAAVR
jgi:predicted ArsR family transcriptional regulator